MHPFIYAFAAGAVIFAWKRYICKKPIGKWFKTGCVVCVVLMVITTCGVCIGIFRTSRQ